MPQFVRWTVFGFSLILVLAGALPLVHPSAAGATSGAPAYAWFHLASACVGLAAFAYRRGFWAGPFALAFGTVDLYQWVASWAQWFPQKQFRWTEVDNGLHLGLGLALVALGAASLWLRRPHR
jgi:uncharacterized protein YjeT (DUF2065 family)